MSKLLGKYIHECFAVAIMVLPTRQGQCEVRVLLILVWFQRYITTLHEQGECENVTRIALAIVANVGYVFYKLLTLCLEVGSVEL